MEIIKSNCAMTPPCFSEPPLLQDKHPQLPQPLLTGFVFETTHQPGYSFLDMIQPLHVHPKLGGQNWTQHSRCCQTSVKHRGRITALVLLLTLFLIRRRPRGWMKEMVGRGWRQSVIDYQPCISIQTALEGAGGQYQLDIADIHR